MSVVRNQKELQKTPKLVLPSDLVLRIAGRYPGVQFPADTAPLHHGHMTIRTRLSSWLLSHCLLLTLSLVLFVSCCHVMRSRLLGIGLCLFYISFVHSVFLSFVGSLLNFKSVRTSITASISWAFLFLKKKIIQHN